MVTTELLIFIAFIGWTALCLWLGYCVKIDNAKLYAEYLTRNLTFRQAAKWLLTHERERHIQDIMGIEKDLESLKDVELPDDLKAICGHVHFEV